MSSASAMQPLFWDGLVVGYQVCMIRHVTQVEYDDKKKYSILPASKESAEKYQVYMHC